MDMQYLKNAKKEKVSKGRFPSYCAFITKSISMLKLRNSILTG